MQEDNNRMNFIAIIISLLVMIVSCEPSEIEKLENKLDACQSENEDLEYSVSSLEKKIEELEEINEDLQNQVDDLEYQVDELSTENDDLDDIIFRAKQACWSENYDWALMILNEH